jgi:hypothetical protein
MDDLYTDHKIVVRVILRKLGVVMYEVYGGMPHVMREKKFDLLFTPMYGENGYAVRKN